jgi:chromosome transmission fidelity protein 1
MRAVNQSIGRSIRHINDYSCIFLLDQRYRKPHVSQQLPQWMQPSLNHCNSFGALVKNVTAFFKEKQVKLQQQPMVKQHP